MLKDITLGQYFPGKSPVHKLDARFKLILTVACIVMLFMAKNMWGLLIGAGFTLLSFLLSRIPLSLMWKSIKPIIPLVFFTALLNLFFVKTGEPVFE